jgi:hypothetical protein
MVGPQGSTGATGAQGPPGPVLPDLVYTDQSNTFTSNQIMQGNVALAPTGTSTASQGFISNPLDLQASTFDGSNAQQEIFRWQAEPTGNNSSSSAGTLNLLFGGNGNKPAETGLSIAPNGVVTFASGQTFPGASAGTITNQAASDAYFGFSGNTTSTGTYNTASGVSALVSNTTGIGNTASGASALTADTTGSDNTANGTAALLSNTTGSSNSASGWVALRDNTTGSNNTASGASALYYNTMGFDNTASGVLALSDNIIGSANTANGFSALSSNSTGSDNTGLGTNAGSSTNNQYTTGSNNTYVGANSNSGTQLTLNNATAIGANAQVTASNSLVLGSINGINGATADALVGVGTTTPAYKLHVGTSNKGLRVEGPPIGGSGTVAASFGGNGDFGIDAPGTVNGRFVVKDNTGFVGIGTASPAYTLDVHGSANFTGPVTFSAGQNFPGLPSLTSNNSFTGNETISGNVNAGSIVTGSTAINNMGCNGAFGGIGFGPNGPIGCANYSLLGDGINTYLNRPAGGALLFREGNAPEMILTSGGNFGIGTTTPQYPLHVNGVMRAETGLSLGGSATVTVDAPGVVGGHFTVLPNGNVGVDNANPAASLDVGGSVRINGDVSMSSNPRMFFTGFLAGNLGNFPAGGYFIPDRNIIITRVTASESNPGHGCSTTAQADLNVKTSADVLYSLDLGNNNYFPDSGSIQVSVAAGTQLWIGVQAASGCGLGGSSPSDVNVVVQYLMQ